MSKYVSVLIDTGLMVAFYDAADLHHESVVQFFSDCTAQLITTVGCVTEVMWLLAPNWRVQNTFLMHLAQGIYHCEPLLTADFYRIAELNTQYADLPGDFSDLALVSISERRKIAEIATLDKDFDIYRRYRKQALNRVFYP
jgi:uncharacterized protein